MNNYRQSNQISISALLSEHPSNVFTTIKMTVWIADISPTKLDLGLRTSAIVFYDLTLGCGSLFRLFLGNDLTIDFGPVLARENLMISGNCDFGPQNEVFYYGVSKLKTTSKKQRSM